MSAEPKAQDSPAWRTIFDGRSLEGWQHIGPGKMVLAVGMIRTEGGMGLFVVHEGEVRRLCDPGRLQVGQQAGQNSGIYIRIADKPEDPWYAVHHGYEVQISDNDDDYHGTGAIYSLSKRTAGPSRPAGRVEYDGDHPARRGDRRGAERDDRVNRLRSRQGSRARSGRRTTSRSGAHGPTYTGYIGLQNHGDHPGGNAPGRFQGGQRQVVVRIRLSTAVLGWLATAR